jgi:hypothetical protein
MTKFREAPQNISEHQSRMNFCEISQCWEGLVNALTCSIRYGSRTFRIGFRGLTLRTYHDFASRHFHGRNRNERKSRWVTFTRKTFLDPRKTVKTGTLITRLWVPGLKEAIRSMTVNINTIHYWYGIERYQDQPKPAAPAIDSAGCSSTTDLWPHNGVWHSPSMTISLESESNRVPLHIELNSVYFVSHCHARKSTSFAQSWTAFTAPEKRTEVQRERSSRNKNQQTYFGWACP